MQSGERAVAYTRPSKIRIGLAVAWLIISLAVGGALGAQPAAEEIGRPAEANTARR